MLLQFLVLMDGRNLSSCAVQALSSSATPSATTASAPPVVTLSVCTGVDCRLDGASECLRRFQQKYKQDLNNDSNQTTVSTTTTTGSKRIVVQARSCLGPCGDGPNVVVLETNGQRVVKMNHPLPPQLPGSWAPPTLFGDNPRGVYQVRTQEQLDHVWNLVLDTAGLEQDTAGEQKTPATATVMEDQDPIDSWIVTSSRPWYDRPRNERRVFQRLMQFMILVGLYQYDTSHGALETPQWMVAGGLALASNWIMRENIVVFLWDKLSRKTQPKQ